MTSAITPQVTHPPLPVAEHLIPRDNGYGVQEVAAVTLGEFTGRVWRHVHRDGDGTRFEFDATIDRLVDGHQACLGHGGGHTTWTCRTCDQTGGLDPFGTPGGGPIVYRGTSSPSPCDGRLKMTCDGDPLN